MSTSQENGGLITIDELRNRLMRSRSKTRKESISQYFSLELKLIVYLIVGMM